MDVHNIRRAVFFEKPDHIPMTFVINDACWHHYPNDWLLDLMEAHPLLFPHFARPQTPYTPEYALVARRDAPYTDDFGCLWKTTDDGITGTVVGHPLADWSSYAGYRMPDPAFCTGIGPVDWTAKAKQIREDRASGRFTRGGLRHGHTFLQLSDLRGFENLLFDMMDGEPRLSDLIEKLECFNLYGVERYCRMGVDMMYYPEDLGMQSGPMISPALFQKYILPSYKRLMKPAFDNDTIVQVHSDGDIRMLVDGIAECGAQVINLQDLVNGIDWIAHRFRGKLCVELDIDRQHVTVRGTPGQVDRLIRDEVRALSTPHGGLMMIYGLYPGTPMQNVEALMRAMVKYAA
ncbi:MAG: hypothetical protein FWG37_04715 [Clostridia bacterium]|nr:hypothetical protein [Clostridia bacterium]